MSKQKFDYIAKCSLFRTSPVTVGTGTRSERIGRVEGRVVLTIDLNKLQHLADRALRSKKGTATMADGALVFKVVPGSVQNFPENQAAAKG